MQESEVAEMGEQEQFYWWHICRRLVWRSILDKWLLESDNPKILESSVSRRTPQNDDGERPTQNNDLMCHPGPTGQGPSSDSGSRPGFQIESGMTKRGEIAAVQQIGPPQNDDGERPTQNDDLMCHPGPTGQGPSSDSGSRPGFQIESGMTKWGEITRNDASTKGMEILDVGCGGGFNLEFLRRWGKVTGIDQSEVALVSAKQHGEAEQGDALQLPRPDESIDLITAFDVLEHLLDDAAALQEWRRALSSGGYVAISVPAYQWLYGPHDKALLHQRRYTLSKLAAKLSQAGFKPIFSSYVFMFTFPIFVAQRLLAKSLGRGAGYNAAPHTISRLLIGLGWIEAWLIRYISLPFGSSVFILAKKI